MNKPTEAVSNRELRDFALVMGAMVILLFGLLIPWKWSGNYPVWPWIFAAAFVSWGFAAPASLAPVFRVWMRFGDMMGRIMGPLILGVIFFIIVLPVGIIARFARRDPMARSFDNDAASYRIKKSYRSPDNMRRPF